MLEVKVTDDTFMVQAGGDVIDMLSEIAMTVSTIYNRMNSGAPENADLFRTLFTQAANTPDGPFWGMDPGPGERDLFAVIPFPKKGENPND